MKYRTTKRPQITLSEQLELAAEFLREMEKRGYKKHNMKIVVSEMNTALYK